MSCLSSSQHAEAQELGPARGSPSSAKPPGPSLSPHTRRDGQRLAGGSFRYRAFLCHEGSQKLGILSVLYHFVEKQGRASEVFFDERMKRGSTRDDDLKNWLYDALYETKTLVVFLTPEFLEKRWPMWEVTIFFNLMDQDEGGLHRQIIPVFYTLSAADCKARARLKYGLSTDKGRMLERMRKYRGVDALRPKQHMSIMQVVTALMNDLFNIDIKNNRTRRPETLAGKGLLHSENYVARELEEREAQRVEDLVADNAAKGIQNYPMKICISGMAYSGKMTMACDLATHLGNMFPDQFFVMMNGTDGVPTEIVGALKTLIVDSGELKEESRVELAKEKDVNVLHSYFRHLVCNGVPTVVVVDDVSSKQVGDICKYIIPAKLNTMFLIICTTRDGKAQEILKEEHNFSQVDTTHLTEDEIAELFRKQATKKSLQVSEAQLSYAARHCHPIVGWAKIVASQVNYSDLETFLAEFSDVRSKQKQNPRNIVEWGIRGLINDGEEELVRLLYMATVFPSSFDRKAAYEVATKSVFAEWGRTKCEVALGALVSRSFLDVGEGKAFRVELKEIIRGRRWRMHPSLRKELRKVETLYLDKSMTSSTFFRSHSQHYALVFRAALKSNDVRVQREAFRLERDNIEQGMSIEGANYLGQNINDVYNVMGHSLLDDYLLEQVIGREIREIPEKDDCAYASLGELHGMILMGVGKLAESEATFKNVLRMYDGLGLRWYVPYALVLHGLGNVLHVQGRNKEAVERLGEAVAILDQLGEYQTVNYADTLQALGTALSAHGKHSEAVKRLEEALEIMDRLGKRHSEACINALQELGSTLLWQERGGEAVERLEEAVQIMDGLGLRESSYCGAVLGELGNALMSQSKFQEAVKSLEEAVGILDGLGLRQSITSSSCLVFLGDALLHVGKEREAEKRLEEAVGILDGLGLRDIHNYSNALLGLGTVLRLQSKYVESVERLEKAMGILERLGEKQSAHFSNICQELGTTLRLQGKHGKSIGSGG